MPRCVLLDSCFFFNNGLTEMPSTTDCLKEKYCLGDYAECARYIAFKTYGRDKVPSYLAPNDAFETQMVPERRGKLSST